MLAADRQQALGTLVNLLDGCVERGPNLLPILWFQHFGDRDQAFGLDVQAACGTFLREKAKHGWRGNDDVWPKGVERGDNFGEGQHEVEVAKLYQAAAHLFVQIAVRAEEKGDAKEFDVGVAKLDSLLPQMGPDYLRMMDGLGDVDPTSAEGQTLTAVFEPLHKQCREVGM